MNSKKHFFLVFLCVIGALSNARCQDERFEFVGALVTSNNFKISLKLNFTVDENGVVAGRSITDYYGENSTESKIEGTLDLESKVLSFHEISNIKTKSDADASSFCYIRVKDIPISVEDEKNIIKGKFNGFFPNGKPCAEGNIFLVGADLLEQLSAKEEITSEEITNDNQNKIEPATVAELVKVINPKEQLKNGGMLNLDWNTNSIKFSVWDSYFEDHDKINIYVNGKLAYEEVEVKERKKTFNLEFVDGKCTIKIEAVNEGIAPPNTVHASVTDGGSVWPFLTKLKEGESATVVIEKK